MCMYICCVVIVCMYVCCMMCSCMEERHLASQMQELKNLIKSSNPVTTTVYVVVAVAK